MGIGTKMPAGDCGAVDACKERSLAGAALGKAINLQAGVDCVKDMIFGRKRQEGTGPCLVAAQDPEGRQCQGGQWIFFGRGIAQPNAIDKNEKDMQRESC